ncbi:Hypothetical protein THC0290_0552 [Flavobacterium psychrophilum]|nr:Hypothetical protein THC0290_0552 [Flavobacterium psychrophilum]
MPVAVVDFVTFQLSVIQNYDCETIIPLNPTIATDSCYAFGFLFIPIFTFQFSVSLPHRLSRKYFKIIIMSKITLKDLGLEEQNKTVQLFVEKLNELTILEKELNSEGFELIIQPIKKKD